MFGSRRAKKDSRKDAFTDLGVVGRALPVPLPLSLSPSSHAPVPSSRLPPTAPSRTELKQILKTRIHSIVDGGGAEMKSRGRVKEERRKEDRRRLTQAERRYRPGVGNSSGADVDELSMLKSIVRDAPLLSRATRTARSHERLHAHEYKDDSEGEDGVERRRKSLARQDEAQELDIFFTDDTRKDSSASSSRFNFREMEERMSGFRHEKFNASKSRSQPSTEADALLEGETLSLVYDPEFGAYYDERTDQYYSVVPNRL